MTKLWNSNPKIVKTFLEIDVEISCACNPTLEDDDSPDSEGEKDALVWTKTFACDASLVENVRSWGCDIEVRIKTLYSVITKFLFRQKSHGRSSKMRLKNQNEEK